MSRLIDADALMADLEKWLKQIDPTHPSEDNAIPPMEDIIVSTLMTIEEQPTIEPQVNQNNKELEEARAHIRYLQDQMSRDSGIIEGLKYAIRYHKVGGADMRREQEC